LVRYIKSNSKPLKEHKRIYRIGKQAIEDLKKGMKFANIEPEMWRDLIK
jgi:hypothetical protein